MAGVNNLELMDIVLDVLREKPMDTDELVKAVRSAHGVNENRVKGVLSTLKNFDRIVHHNGKWKVKR